MQGGRWAARRPWRLLAQGQTSVRSTSWGRLDSWPSPSRSRFLQFGRNERVLQIQSIRTVCGSLAT